MDQEMEITLRGYQIIEKIVKNSNTSGRVYVPNEWVGKRVKVILLEPEIVEDDSNVGGSGI